MFLCKIIASLVYLSHDVLEAGVPGVQPLHVGLDGELAERLPRGLVAVDIHGVHQWGRLVSHCRRSSQAVLAFVVCSPFLLYLVFTGLGRPHQFDASDHKDQLGRNNFSRKGLKQRFSSASNVITWAFLTQ